MHQHPTAQLTPTVAALPTVRAFQQLPPLGSTAETTGDLAYLIPQGKAAGVAVVAPETSTVSSWCTLNAQFKLEQMGTYVYFTGRTTPNDPQPGVMGTVTIRVVDPTTKAQCKLQVMLTVDGQSAPIVKQPTVLQDNVATVRGKALYCLCVCMQCHARHSSSCLLGAQARQCAAATSRAWSRSTASTACRP